MLLVEELATGGDLLGWATQRRRRWTGINTPKVEGHAGVGDQADFEKAVAFRMIVTSYIETSGRTTSWCRISELRPSKLQILAAAKTIGEGPVKRNTIKERLRAAMDSFVGTKVAWRRRSCADSVSYDAERRRSSTAF